MSGIPCKDCICLAICRSLSNSVYDEIILANLHLTYDAYDIMTIIENRVTGPLTKKCNSITSYIAKREDSYIDSIDYGKLLAIMAYLNSPLYTLYEGAREHAEKMYQQYLDNKNKKMKKDIRYG